MSQPPMYYYYKPWAKWVLSLAVLFEAVCYGIMLGLMYSDAVFQNFISHPQFRPNWLTGIFAFGVLFVIIPWIMIMMLFPVIWMSFSGKPAIILDSTSLKDNFSGITFELKDIDKVNYSNYGLIFEVNNEEKYYAQISNLSTRLFYRFTNLGSNGFRILMRYVNCNREEIKLFIENPT